MKEATSKFQRIASFLMALVGALAIFMVTMSAHDKYREKLLQHPTHPTAGTLLVSAPYPQKIKDSELLLEIKIKSEKKHGQVVVTLNEREIGHIQAHGHHFIKVPRKLFRSHENSLFLRGLAADSVVSMMEIKNLYGFSTGLLKSVLVLPHTSSIKKLPWPLATLLALLLLFFSVFAPTTMALTSENRLMRYGAWIVIAFFLAIMILPLFVSGRIFLGLKTTLLLFGILLWPGLSHILRCIASFLKFQVLPWSKEKLLRQYFNLSRVLQWIKTRATRIQLRPFHWRLIAILALMAIFVFYAAYRQRYVGAADWYGYYAESLLFRQGQLTMKTAFSPAQYPALAPLGFFAKGNKILPQYPPGFPLLLALFGLLGLEFFVNALCGILTIFILYLILRDLVGRGLALVYTALWTFFPIALQYSMNLMSDLVATLFILLTYYFFRRKKIFWSGMVFAFAVTVRPSNVLFFIILLPLLIKKKKFWSFCFSAAIIGSFYGLYNWTIFGKPWMTGYGSFSYDLTSTVFFPHFFYYGKTILIMMSPLLLIPALLTLVRRKPNCWFYLSWFASYWIFYSFWRAGGDTWWYLRFLLPGLPALFILSALGMKDIHDLLLTWKPRWRLLLNVSAILILLALLPYFIDYSKQNQVFSIRPGEIFYKACKKTQSLVPADALVGGLEMSGPIRLYGGLESFRWDFKESLKLINDFLVKGRPIYLLIEPWHKQHPAIKKIAATFNLKDIAVLPESMGTLLSQVSLREE